MAKGKTLAQVCLVLGLAAAIAAWKSPAAQAETITVTHWGGQFYGVPYAVAMAKGLFKKNGVDVTGILTAAGGGTAVRNTLAGGVPFGEVSLAAAVQAINSGQKLIIIGAGAQSVADQMWVVKKDSALKRHQGSGRQANCLYRARLGEQHADPDGAEGQRIDPAAGETRAGRRSRRQHLRRQQRRDRCRLLRRTDLRAEQGTGETPLHGARHIGSAHDADRDDHDRGICRGRIPISSRA